MSKVFTVLKRELLEMLPPTIFFFITLHIVALVRVLMLEGTGLTPGTMASMTIAALVLGKSVLLADMLPFINRYPGKPAVFNVTWKSVIYLLVAMFIHYLEKLIEFSREAGGIMAGNEKLLAEIIWSHFWAIQLLLGMLIVFYCMMDEVVRIVGGDKMRRMFFGPMQEADRR